MKSPALIKALSLFIPTLKQISHYRGWPRSVVSPDALDKSLIEILKSSPYGRCVYHCDNNVVDNQVVAMQFENKISASLSMHGHSHLEGRSTRIEGALGSLTAFFGLGNAWINVDHHGTGRRSKINTTARSESGHGGGDQELFSSFLESLAGDSIKSQTSARESLESHLLAIAADTARLENRIVKIDEFR